MTVRPTISYPAQHDCVCVYDVCDLCWGGVCLCVCEWGGGAVGEGRDQWPTHGCNLMENCPAVPVRR